MSEKQIRRAGWMLPSKLTHAAGAQMDRASDAVDAEASVSVPCLQIEGPFTFASHLVELGEPAREERFLPTQHCPQVNAFLFGEVAAQELLAWQVHKRGHHKLENLLRFVSMTDNVSGIVYSKQYGAW